MAIETMPEEEIIEPSKGAKTVEEYLTEYDEKGEKPLLVEPIVFADLEAEETAEKISKPIHHRRKTLSDRMAVQTERYNPSESFDVGGHKIMAVREESHTKESDSRIRFFEQIKDPKWTPIEGAPVLEGYQDPFYLGEIQGKRIFGAVKIEADSEGNITNYWTEIFAWKDDISQMEKVASGPDRMKGVRIFGKEDGGIGVFIRPQGGEYGRGKLGFNEIENLSELQETLSQVENFQIIEGVFDSKEWGGINDLHLLKDGRIGVIGHIAGEKNGVKDYYAVAAVFDPKTRQLSDWEIIATAEDIPEEFGIKPKKPDLNSVLYPGGSIRNEDGTMTLFCGAGDTKAVKFIIKDPFLKYES